jgi:hypothetical protein
MTEKTINGEKQWSYPIPVRIITDAAVRRAMNSIPGTPASEIESKIELLGWHSSVTGECYPLVPKPNGEYYMSPSDFVSQ